MVKILKSDLKMYISKHVLKQPIIKEQMKLNGVGGSIFLPRSRGQALYIHDPQTGNALFLPNPQNGEAIYLPRGDTQYLTRTRNGDALHHPSGESLAIIPWLLANQATISTILTLGNLALDAGSKVGSIISGIFKKKEGGAITLDEKTIEEIVNLAKNEVVVTNPSGVVTPATDANRITDSGSGNGFFYIMPDPK